MPFPSCEMRRVDSMPAVFNGQPGDFTWRHQTRMVDGTECAPYRTFCAKLPSGDLCEVPIAPAPAGMICWQWVANAPDETPSEDRPTLAPSIDLYITNSKDEHQTLWHGNVTVGRMVGA